MNEPWETEPEDTEDGGIWLSIGDLMSGLLMFFALLFVTVQLQLQEKLLEVARLEKTLQEKIAQLEQYQEAFDRLPAAILAALNQEMPPGIQLNVDLKTGDVSIPDAILFDENSAELKSQGKQFLQQFVPAYSQVIFANDLFDRQITRIIIEGHTSSKGEERANMSLSLRRSLAVTDYILSDALTFPSKPQFTQKILAAGRGERDANSNRDEAGDRKVVFRFQLRRQGNFSETLLP